MNAMLKPGDIRKAVTDSLSNPSEDIARHVLAMAGANPNQIEKSYVTALALAIGGLVGGLIAGTAFTEPKPPSN